MNIYGDKSRMGETAAVMQSKRGSPLTRARWPSGRRVKPCKPHPASKEVRRRIGGAKDDAWAGKERWLTSLTTLGESGNSSRRTHGWYRGPAAPSTRVCTGKGSVVVEGLLPMATTKFKGWLGHRKVKRRPEEPLSIRQEKDMTRVIFCSSKGYEVTGHACVGGLQRSDEHQS